MSGLPVLNEEYSPVLQRLLLIEKRIEKAEKKIKDMQFWFWGIPIGALVGFYWNDIMYFLGSLFK